MNTSWILLGLSAATLGWLSIAFYAIGLRDIFWVAMTTLCQRRAFRLLAKSKRLTDTAERLFEVAKRFEAKISERVR